MRKLFLIRITWIPAFAGMTILATCTSPQSRPYALQAPIAQSGPQYILLGQKIDINTADAPTLVALPGIGPSLAQRIVDPRGRYGSFGGVQDLQRVPGIGPRLTSRLAPLIRVSSKNWQR